MKSFRNAYLVFVQWIALCLTLLTGKVVRHLIILKGKDPDYVAPPPPPITPMLPTRQELHEESLAVLNKFYSAPRSSNIGNVDWVRNLADHPIMKSRTTFEARQAASKLASQAKTVPTVNEQAPAPVNDAPTTESPLQVVEPKVEG